VTGLLDKMASFGFPPFAELGGVQLAKRKIVGCPNSRSFESSIELTIAVS